MFPRQNIRICSYQISNITKNSYQRNVVIRAYVSQGRKLRSDVLATTRYGGRQTFRSAVRQRIFLASAFTPMLLENVRGWQNNHSL